ncbi:DUF3006 domain-containing protein [Neobacillus jeddahensis]|uniref:DUF3006 domain-containing protein n=1 Tax=Neobacillus jeddahensis TaxID=1461580 RepID=UPI00058BBAEE|nr:DUF3006 domain-containing protein [Neobacillus jeddahensis]
MKLIIDRFEGDLVVCEKEDGTFFDIRRNRLPSGAKVGDLLVMDQDQITIDVTGTHERREKIRKVMEDLWE